MQFAAPKSARSTSSTAARTSALKKSQPHERQDYRRVSRARKWALLWRRDLARPWRARHGSRQSRRAGRDGGVAHADDLPPLLKLATWNLEWLNRRDGTGPVKRSDEDYARLRGYAERLAADVVAFQEVDGSEAAARVFDPSVYQLHAASQNDVQRTGFAVRRGIPLTIHPDYQALDVGQVRVGADISVEYGGGVLRLLSVHLKSSCFDDPLSSDKRDCKKLAAQLPILEAWIDARGNEHAAAVVLGDFNRRLFEKPDEPFWHELDDADPPESDLWSPTDGPKAACWNGHFPDFIDHLVFNQPAAALVRPDSFEQCQYDASDAQYKRVLSDHCPLAITLGAAGSGRVLRARVKWPPTDAGVQLGHNVQIGPNVKIGQHAQLTPASDATQHEHGLIKANINRGRKLYHAPECPGYEATRVDEAKGERWFATAKQAETAGWTRASNCPR
ncbi:MAG: Endonuclease/exonuclease/phosphatase [Myxococcaceae bacterium]|nr:Endonuclease/exonuclease/phosphatase [Myxococcaceae bacterium]